VIVIERWYNVHFAVEDGQALTFAGNSFDTVICNVGCSSSRTQREGWQSSIG
jgi:ubiquinone/menaquinone biosynthesis C-methylase UbiE